MGTEHHYSLILWSMFSGIHLGLCSPSVSHSPDLTQSPLLPEPADFSVLLALKGCLWLKNPQIPLQKIGWLPCPPLSFPNFLGFLRKYRASKAGERSWSGNHLQQPETSWRVELVQACRDKEVWPCHLDAVRLPKIEGAQILQKFERKREKKDKDGVPLWGRECCPILF